MILVHVVAVHRTFDNVGCTKCSESKTEGAMLNLLLDNNFRTAGYWQIVCIRCSVLYAECQLLLQLRWVSLVGNRLNGTLPSSWAGLTQASHTPNTHSG